MTNAYNNSMAVALPFKPIFFPKYIAPEREELGFCPYNLTTIVSDQEPMLVSPQNNTSLVVMHQHKKHLRGAVQNK
jgi:hypothetical protein